ncbi:MAG: DUF4836 family protein [Bacteroidales bacterium]|nr:DUF4836 family protein [Bacteroidales bacterium]
MKISFRKRFMSSLANVALIVLTLASCSKKADLGDYVPDDAIGVVSVDMNELWNKADLSNIEQLSFAKLGLQELRSEDPQTAAIVDGILKDPRSTGLDLKGDLLIWVKADEEVTFRGGFLMTMHKRKKFEEFLTKLAADNDFELTISDLKGFRVAKINNAGAGIVFNKTLAMLVPGGTNLESLLDMKHRESIASDKQFRKYWKNRSEISLWMSFDHIFEMAEDNGVDMEEIMAETGLGKDYWDAVKGSSIAANLTFDKGVIRTTFEMMGINGRTMNAYMQKFNSDLVKYMPENTLLTFAMGYNLKQVVNILERQQDEEIDLDEKVTGDKTVRDVINAFGGSVLFSLFDIETYTDGRNEPLMAVALDINDAETIRTLLAEAKMEEVDGIYALSNPIGLGFNIYIALNKKAMYITNSEMSAKTFIKGGYKDALKSVAKKVKKGNYLYADLTIDDYPLAIQEQLPDGAVSLLRNYLEYTEIQPTGKTSGEWNIYIRDKKQNSLLSTLHFIDDHLVELGNLIGSTVGSISPEYEEEFYVEEETELGL